MLKVNFENLGPITKGEIDVKGLTVLCGENNTGKTYASYTAYEVLKEFGNLRGINRNHPNIDQMEIDHTGHMNFDLNDIVEQQLPLITKMLSSKITNDLYKIFSSKQDAFMNSKVFIETNVSSYRDYARRNIPAIKYESRVSKGKFEINFIPDIEKLSITYSALEGVGEKEVLKNFLKTTLDNFISWYLKREVFLLPAERSGLNLFFKELNAARNELIRELSVDLLNDNISELGKNLKQSISAYPTPISDYLTFLNRFDTYDNKESSFKDLAQEIQTDILKGSYEVHDQQILYKNADGASFHLHVTSSTVKSLFGLVFYLTYMAETGAYLIIDEPELNLHPDNQRKLAKILAKLVNRGLNVILSTHSDYMIKEFNNLIMLSKPFAKRDEVMKKFDYDESQVLQRENVAPYLFIDNEIVPMEIDQVEGIIAETFDKVINRYNEAADEIYYALQEEQDGQ